MKEINMKSFKEFLMTNYFKNGAFIGLTFNEETLSNLKDYFEKNNIKNCIDLSEVHTTLLYSKKGISNYIPTNKLKGEILIPKALHIWKTQEGSNCLVCELKNDRIVKYHNNLIKYHNASHDYPEYIPHVTFSYDCGNLDENSIELPDFNFVVENEQLKSLDENWLQKKLG